MKFSKGDGAPNWRAASWEPEQGVPIDRLDAGANPERGASNGSLSAGCWRKND